uniref:Uncharacterized protein n=1 Tax=Rhizophora mucronata TaxID=61149 RepID=A0A2P2Q9D4_RHIMU
MFVNWFSFSFLFWFFPQFSCWSLETLKVTLLHYLWSSDGLIK